MVSKLQLGLTPLPNLSQLFDLLFVFPQRFNDGVLLLQNIDEAGHFVRLVLQPLLHDLDIPLVLHLLIQNLALQPL